MRFRRLALATTVVTYVLLLVGVYTKEVGADLACDMRWPLCDGYLGLFPATLPSAIEWSHRLLSLVVGLLLVVVLYRAWTGYGRTHRITRAATVAVLLLPIQAGLGALTVLKGQLFTGELRFLLEPLISVAHYGTGVLFFAALLATTVWAYESRRPPGDGGTETTAAGWRRRE